MSKNQRKWIFAAIKLAVALVLIWGVRRTVMQAVGELREHPLHLNVALLVAAGGLYLCAMLPSAVFWWHVMRVMGQNVRLPAAIRAYYIGGLGKYVPGKALVPLHWYCRPGFVPGDQASSDACGCDRQKLFVETLTMMASGSFIAAALIALNYHEHLLYAAVAIAFMLAAGLPTLPPVFKQIIRLTRVGRANPAMAEQLERIHYGTLLFGWLATAIGWLIMGASLIAVLRGMGQAPDSWLAELSLAMMAVSVSVVLGFMSFIPGGFVVRDVVMADLIKPRLGSEVAVASAIVLRLAWLAAEVGAAGVFYLLHMLRAKPRANSSPQDEASPSNSSPR